MDDETIFDLRAGKPKLFLFGFLSTLFAIDLRLKLSISNWLDKFIRLPVLVEMILFSLLSEAV